MLEIAAKQAAQHAAKQVTQEATKQAVQESAKQAAQQAAPSISETVSRNGLGEIESGTKQPSIQVQDDRFSATLRDGSKVEGNYIQNLSEGQAKGVSKNSTFVETQTVIDSKGVPTDYNIYENPDGSKIATQTDVKTSAQLKQEQLEAFATQVLISQISSIGQG